MSGYDLFTALGQISDKTAARTVARSKKAKTRETAAKILKAVSVAASIVLIVGFAVFMWYFAQKMKDPPIDPAASDTEAQTKTADTQPEQQESYVQKLTKAIEEYFSQDYEKNVENIDGTPQIKITTLDVKPHEGWGQFYGGIYVYAASKIERHGVTAHVGDGDAQYGVLLDEVKYFALAAEPDMQFTSNIDVEQVGDYLFLYGSGMRVSVVIGDKYYYGLKEAYEAGVIDDIDLYAASLFFGSDSAKISYSAVRLNGVTTGINAERINGMCMIPFVRLMDAMFGVREESVGRYTFEFNGRKYDINVIDPAAGDAETGEDYLRAALEEKGEEQTDDLAGRLNFRHEELNIEEEILKRFFELAGIEATVQDPSAYNDINIMIDLTDTTKVSVESILINSPSLLLEVGESMKLTATVYPDNAFDKTLNWSVRSGPEYAEITPDGAGFTVTGVKPGVCYVNAHSNDGSGVSAAVRITVVGSLRECETQDLIEEYIRCKIVPGSESKAKNIVNILITGGDEKHAKAASYCAVRYFGEADPAVRACLSWMFSKVADGDIFSVPVTYPLNYVSFVSTHLRRTDGENYSQETDYMNYPERIEPLIADYVRVAEEYAATRQAKVVMNDHYATYATLVSLGFDGFLPGEPDIAYRAREAIAVLNELLQAVKYGIPPEGITEYTRKEYSMYEEYWGRDDHMHTESRYLYSIDAFYAYFEKYLPKDTVKNFIERYAVYSDVTDIYEAVYIHDKTVNLSGDLALNLFREYVIPATAMLESQNGNKATVSVDFVPATGLGPPTLRMTLDIEEDKNGVRITGGELIEKIFAQSADAVETAYKAMKAYMVLRQGKDYERHGQWEKYEDLPDEYKDKINPDAQFPVMIAGYVLNGLERVSDEIYGELTKKTDVYDGVFVYPDKAPGSVEIGYPDHPGIRFTYETDGSHYYYAHEEFLMSVRIIKSDKNGATLCADFEVDGEVRSYTFEITYKNGKAVLTGGTFVTDIVFGK